MLLGGLFWKDGWEMGPCPCSAWPGHGETSTHHLQDREVYSIQRGHNPSVSPPRQRGFPTPEGSQPPSPGCRAGRQRRPLTQCPGEMSSWAGSGTRMIWPRLIRVARHSGSRGELCLSITHPGFQGSPFGTFHHPHNAFDTEFGARC